MYSDDLSASSESFIQTKTPQKIGRVATPPGKESTTDSFYFWVARDCIVEKTQIIRADCLIAGRRIAFYAVVSEVFRQSRKADLSEEVDESDGDPDFTPAFPGEGFTYAKAFILRVVPVTITPPLNGSAVWLCDEAGAALAYGADEIHQPLVIGMIKNGGTALAGQGMIDLEFLLGANGGHMNVNGVAGRAAKSSFLLFTIRMLMEAAQRQAVAQPSARDRLLLVPVILNVKGYDLFHMHCWNRAYRPAEHEAEWRALGWEAPHPFDTVEYYARQERGQKNAIPIPTSGVVSPYSWSLRDLVENGLLLYLFADEDSSDVNFGALVMDIESWLTAEQDGRRALRSEHTIPQTLDELLAWIGRQAFAESADVRFRSHHASTWRKLHRRLLKLLLEGSGVLCRDRLEGSPLNLLKKAGAARTFQDGTCGPLVVDLFGLNQGLSLQRFVVATLLRQMIELKAYHQVPDNLVFLIAIDELNRFAPHGSKDPITQLIDRVATEMRSQGIILLGAQQQASKVSEKVIDNAAIRVLGRTGGLELSTQAWRFLNDSARKLAANLRQNEKLVVQDSFREPLLVQVPFPVWAMKGADVADPPPGEAGRSPAGYIPPEIDPFNPYQN